VRGATYSCAFSRWVIEDTTEVQVLYQPEITPGLHITLSGYFLRNVTRSLVHTRRPHIL